MTWWTATSVSVNNGQTIVNVNTGDDVQIAQEAGGLVIGNQPPVEIKRTFLDGSNNKKIELRLPWPYANQTNQPAVAFPTDADLAEATRILREIAADFDMQPTASSVAVRTSDGRLKATNAVESNDAVVLGQLGSAAFSYVTTSSTDTTPGRLMKTGDGGLLGSASGNTTFLALNDVTASIFNAQLNASATGVPGPESGDGAVFTHKQWAGDSAYQEFHRINKTYERYKWSSAFTNWFMRYHQGNILGAVSQSGGSPTGAIIERGSNSNGEFVRFADGTQICTRTVVLVDGAAPTINANYQIFIGTFSFPVAFSGLPAVSIANTGGFAGRYYAAIEGQSETSWGTGNGLSIRNLDGTSRQITVEMFLTAIGRWY